MSGLLRLSTRFLSRAALPSELNLSPSALKRLHHILAPDERLRIEVDGGGCSGFEYKLRLDAERQQDDVVLSHQGREVVVVDEMSLSFISGATVDYVEELMRSSFRITENPKADKSCSCGTSFAIKE